MFHLINQVRAVKGSLLLTAEKHPAAWDVTLPDLASRLKAVPVAELGAPDDSLLRGVLVKLFADHQLGVDETVISYLIARMPRSLAAARLLVDDIDRQSLEQKADITRPFAARVLAGFSAPGMFDDDS